MTSSLQNFFCVLLCLAGLSLSVSGEEPPWHEIKSKHFIVTYAGSEEFARKVIKEAEKLYDSITEKLGFKRYDNFWLWDDRARIKIYADHESFKKGENAPGWAAGKALVTGREIRAYETSAGFCSSVLPHELSHLIFREFTGLGSDVPSWLDEGVAQLQEDDRKKGMQILHAARAQGKLIPLAKLVSLRPEQLSGLGPALFYAQSLSIVDFMIEKYGAARFRKFCGALKDGRSVEDALRFTYPDPASNIERLEKAWLKHLEEVK